MLGPDEVEPESDGGDTQGDAGAEADRTAGHPPATSHTRGDISADTVAMTAGPSPEHATDATGESGAPRDAVPESPADVVAAAILRWQRALADVGGRNTLLWYQDLPLGTLDLTTAHPGGVSKLLAGRPTTIADLVREPSALADAQARARAIATTSARVLEQRGLPIAFLAIGMATWDVGARRHPTAPVLLRPVTLRPTGTAANDFEIDLGDEVEVNPVLIQALRAQAGVELDDVTLAERASDSGGFNPGPVYDALQEACVGLPGFAVAPRLVIATFPHSKLDMVADLAALGPRLVGPDLVAALAGDLAAADRVRDHVLDPPGEADRDARRERLVLDADAAQADVVDAVLQGASLAVSAPPGTGATQTVASLVAALVGEGRSVLLVSPRRRDLTEAVARLASVGLGEVVLDAVAAGTDRRATLHQVVDAFQSVIDRDAGGGESPAAPDPDELTSHRNRLRDHVDALHELREPWGVSLHESQWAIAELALRRPPPTSRVRLTAEALRDLPRTRLDELVLELTAAAQAGAWSADEADDPWYGAHVVTVEDADRAREIVTRLDGGGLDRVTSVLDVIFEESSLPTARSVTDWGRALETMAGVRATLEVFRPEVFDNPLDEHVAATASGSDRGGDGGGLSAWTRSRVRSQARKLLRPGRPPQDLHAELVAARSHRRAWHDLVGAGGRPEISPRLDEARELYAALYDDLSWLGLRLATTSAGGDLTSAPLAELGDRVADLAARTERLDILPQVIPVIEDLRDSGMGDVVDDFAARSVPAEQVGAELENLWWLSIVRQVTGSDRRYAGHDGAALREAVDAYADADRAMLTATAHRIRRTVDRGLRAAVARERVAAAGLLAEVDGARRPRRIRELLAQASGLLQATHPCWAMSPYAVGEVVPADVEFDVVVLDSAGQLTTAEAISAIARGRAVVAFGDPAGIPPAPFSTAATGQVGVSVSAPTESDDRPAAATSVFEDLAALLPTRSLTWHYASYDERLIAAADHTAYGSELVTFPGADVASPVRVERVAGSGRVVAGDDAAIEATEAEVERVVDLVLEHARDHPDESLGVIGVTVPQAARLRDVLDHELRRAPLALAGFFDPARPEPFAVHSLFDAGGSRWDAVIVSVGYGKTPHGRLLHRFPDLAQPGADRLLASALTRARRRLTVVTALASTDIEVDRVPGVSGAATGTAAGAAAGTAGAAGVAARVLHDLLADVEAAAASTRAMFEGDAVRARDPLMADLASRLRREGLEVAEDVGTSARTLDLVVRNPRVPGRPLLVVEGDGASYAGLHGTRERDRLWVQHLTTLGWRHLRIWSTDLYRDPAREVARVVAATRPDHDEPLPAPPGEDTPESSSSLPHAAPPTSPPTSPTGASTRSRRATSRATGPASGEDGLDGGSELSPSTDDTDAGWGERNDEDGHDRWLTEQRPPHWG